MTILYTDQPSTFCMQSWTQALYNMHYKDRNASWFSEQLNECWCFLFWGLHISNNNWFSCEIYPPTYEISEKTSQHFKGKTVLSIWRLEKNIYIYNKNEWSQDLTVPHTKYQTPSSSSSWMIDSWHLHNQLHQITKQQTIKLNMLMWSLFSSEFAEWLCFTNVSRFTSPKKRLSR